MKIDKKELEAYKARKREAKNSALYKNMKGDTVSFAASSAFYSIATCISGTGIGAAEYGIISEALKDPKYLFVTAPLGALILLFGGGITYMAGANAVERAKAISEIKRFKEELINNYGTEKEDAAQLKLKYKKFIDSKDIYSEM